MVKSLKNILFAVFFVVLFVEFICSNISFINFQPLNGSQAVSLKPKFSLKNWLNGKFQDSTSVYLEDAFVAHPFFVRLNNQVNYSLFDEINVVRVEEGKDGYFFDNGYIESYFGEDYVSEEYFEEKSKKLKFIQEHFKKMGTIVLFTINQGKASYFFDKLPSKYNFKLKKRSNYDACVEKFKKYDINYIDFREYLSKVRDTSRFPIFPKLSVHWSGFAAVKTADTLIRYMENISGTKLKKIKYLGGEVTSVPRGTDDDIYQSMNLFIPKKSDLMYYPFLNFEKNDSAIPAPNALFVGDSFVWTWIGFYNIIPAVFSNKSEYWYYNKEVFWPLEKGKLPYSVSTLNLNEKIKNRDFIILSFNESSLVNCGFDFIEQAYDLLKKGKD
jgi:hypothetical protein